MSGEIQKSSALTHARGGATCMRAADLVVAADSLLAKITYPAPKVPGSLAETRAIASAVYIHIDRARVPLHHPLSSSTRERDPIGITARLLRVYR